jgi:hypothetical protein
VWVFTETGFVSAVVHFDDPDLLMVRARDRKSLDGLREVAGVSSVTDTPDGDYPHRIVVRKSDFSEWLLDSIGKMAYHNYKSRVATVRGYDFAAPLHDVWEVMHDVEEDPYRKSMYHRPSRVSGSLYDFDDVPFEESPYRA